MPLELLSRTIHSIALFTFYSCSARVYMEEEFEEEDIWSMMRETKDESPKNRNPKEVSFSSSRKVSSAARRIPRSNAHGEESSGAAMLRRSAPVNIPDWSKIYRQSSLSNADGVERGVDAGEHEQEEDDEEDRVPPHEWIAMKLARSQISSFSVCEGAGRTLKGRDQRKVRNAVLTRTGFLE